MGAEDVWMVSMAAPQAKLYLTHLDNVSHASITRQTLRSQLLRYDLTDYDMLNDGESRSY